MKACVFTLGCKMNEVESMSLMRGLEELGYETIDYPAYADLYVLNTCAVTKEAEHKSRQAVARLRKFNPNAPVVVCGCASEHNAKAFETRGGVTFVSGAMGKGKLFDYLSEKGSVHFCEHSFGEMPAPKRSKTRAYLRIQDGCNRFCSYCLIPYLRGRTRSRSAEKILEEARSCGAKEIVLTGIDISSYEDGETKLGDLLLILKDIPARIRLGSLEPCAVTEAFLEKMRAAGNVCEHFHLSLQSGSSEVLKAMNRRYTREEYLRTCARIYRFFPNAAITTDIIVGYPTETEEDFSESLSIVEEAGLARVHAFPFSPREGTNAAKLKDLPSAVKKERMGRMLEKAKRAEKVYLEKKLGSKQIALFETGATPHVIPTEATTHVIPIEATPHVIPTGAEESNPQRNKARFFDCAQNDESETARLFDCARNDESETARFFDCARNDESETARLFDCAQNDESKEDRFFDCAQNDESEKASRTDGEIGGGYTANYIRVYAAGAKEGGVYRVRLKEIYKDGARAEILEEL